MTTNSTRATDYYAGGFRKMIGGVPCKVFARRLPDGRYVNAKDSAAYDARYDDPKHGVSRLSERCDATPDMVFSPTADAVEMVAPAAPVLVLVETVEAIDWAAVAEMPAPIAPPAISAEPAARVSLAKPPLPAPAPIAAAAPTVVDDAAAVVSAAIADGMDYATAERVFVGLCHGLPIATAADGWARTQGKQRDRKATNRGKLLIGTHALDRVREAFGYVYRDAPRPAAAAPIDPTPLVPVDPAPLAPVEPLEPAPAIVEPSTPVPAAGGDLAAVVDDLAALAARVAALQAAPAPDARRAARLRIVRAYLRMRGQRQDARRHLDGMTAAYERAAARATAAETAQGTTWQSRENMRARLDVVLAKRTRTAARLSYSRAALGKSERATASARADVATVSARLAGVEADLARLQPLASALAGLMPTAGAAPMPAPVLVASNGRDNLRAAA